MVFMTKEGSTKIMYFTTPGAWVLILGRGHISHFSEYVVSSTLSIYSTLVAIVYISFTIVDLQLFYDGAVDIQI